MKTKLPENLFQEELRQPVSAIPYRISRTLQQSFPDKAVLEVESSCFESDAFDVEAFAEAGHCSAVVKPGIHSQVQVAWQGPDREPVRRAANAWFDVVWEGRALEVVTASWSGFPVQARHHWIVADSDEVADDFFEAVCAWCHEPRGELLVFSGGGWHKSRDLLEDIRQTDFDSLVLRGTLKEDIRSDFEQFLAARETYDRYDVPWKRGVLFMGPPGNGKTHCVKALVNDLGIPCLYVRSFAPDAPYSSEHASIRKVFARARQSVPCLLVIEDLDALISEANRAFLLHELDGFAANTGIITLATSNHPERLDDSVLDRPSRFDRKYRFELPGTPERVAYLSLQNEKLGSQMRIPPHGIAEIEQLTDGFSFAYLKELFLSSVMRWVADREPGTMLAIMAEQVAKLRDQMRHEPEPPPAAGVHPDEVYD